MKKLFYIFAAMLLVATSCSQDSLTPAEQGGDRVTFTMNLNLPERSVITKTMGDVPGKNLNVYVFVFGKKGNLNDFVQAIPANDDDFDEDGNGHYFKEYAVSLKKTDSEQHVHVVATNRTLDLTDMLDGGTSISEEIMDTFKTEGTDDAYWQYLFLGDGTNATGAAAAFNNLKLVRNFAKITVNIKDGVTLPSGVTNFELIGFEVYNKPTTGTFVIKNKDDNNKDIYFSQYSTYTSFANLQAAYPGYMFSEDDIDTENANKFPEGGNGDGKMVDYLYERTVESIDATHEATYLILKCSFDDGTQTGLIRYYRLDLVDENEDYLPIYRNYLYALNIKAIGNRGYTTIAEAQQHSSNGNISMDPATQELDDISDGISRMYVQYIEKVFVQSSSAQTGYFRYKYLPDAEDETASAAATLTTPDNTALVTVPDNWTSGGTIASDKWYDLSFTIPANTQTGIATFRVTGTNPAHQNKKLIRTIRIRVEARKSFGTITAPTTIAVNGSGTVTVTLPDELPASMFPLELKFEDSANALNPDVNSEYGKDLVAGGGPSLTGSGVNAVQFTKTVSFTDYTASKTVTVSFKRIVNGQTRLYVGNEYFTTSGPQTIN